MHQLKAYSSTFLIASIYFKSALCDISDAHVFSGSQDKLFDFVSIGLAPLLWRHLSTTTKHPLGVSPACQKSLQQALEGIRNGQMWAYKRLYIAVTFFFDSSWRTVRLFNSFGRFEWQTRRTSGLEHDKSGRLWSVSEHRHWKRGSKLCRQTLRDRNEIQPKR